MNEPILLVELPGLRILSESNTRGHWSKRYKRAREQRQYLALTLSQVSDATRSELKKAGKLNIVFTRYGRKLFDRGNLAVSFKALEDELSRWLGIDDGDGRWLSHYAQEQSKSYSVSIALGVHVDQ